MGVRLRYQSLLACLLLAAMALLAGCGGGGGGESFIGAGEVRISIAPSKIDAGDRTQLSITIQDVHPDGVVLKIFFPYGLVYVPQSSLLTVGDKEDEVAPAVNQAADTGIFLVYFFSQKTFGNDKRGVLTLELEGSDKVQEGKIGVDIDVDDPLIDNNIEFDIEDPQYEPEDLAEVEVTG